MGDLSPGRLLPGRSGNSEVDDFLDPVNAMHGPPGSKKGGPATNESAVALADIAKKMYAESSPLRQGLISRSKSFLDGGADITQTPQFAALKSSTDRAFGRAKDNIISRVPGGGGLTSALAGLEGGRASDMTQGMGALTENELNRALGLVNGSTPQAISGLNGAANIQAQQMQAQSAQSAAAKQGAGAGLGMLLAAFMS